MCSKMRHTLLSWVRAAGAADSVSIPNFIRNKIAQLLVFIIQAYPLGMLISIVVGVKMI